MPRGSRSGLPHVPRWPEGRKPSGLAQHLRDEEGELQRLHPVQARVTDRLVAVAQVDLGKLLATAHTFGDVITGELDVHAAGPGADRSVHVEEALDLDRKSPRLNSSH